MKKLTFTLLVPLLSIPLFLSAQVLTKDSLALIAIYEGLGGDQSGLSWDTTQTVDNWSANPDEIQLEMYPIEYDEGDGNGGIDLFTLETLVTDPILPGPGNKYVVGLNLSNLGLSGTLSNRINDLDSLREFRIANNQMSTLSDSLLIDRLVVLDVSKNLLVDLPFINPVRSRVLEMDCSDNHLKFEDIVFLLGKKIDMAYSPQADIPLFEYARDPGDSVTMNAYEEHPALATNVYDWEKDGNTIATSGLLTINPVDTPDAGYYLLSVTNPLAPDLTITAPSYLKVPAEADPNSFITNNPDPGDTTIVIRVCPCLEEDLDMYLWDELNGWIESDTTRMGSGGGTDKDTSELNFEILLEPRVESYFCNVSFGRARAPLTGSFPVPTAVIGTGIALHDSLRAYFAVHNSGSVPCFAPGDRLALDLVTGNKNFSVIDPHETHVAGIMTRNLPGNVNLRVVDAKIFAEKAYLFDLICAIHLAVERGAKVINLSLGYEHVEPSIYLYKALKKAEENDVLVVVSAGNRGRNNDIVDRWPGNFGIPQVYKEEKLPALTNIIVVAALNQAQNGLAIFSNRGAETVNIAAPGTTILSTVVDETGNSTYAVFSGTSMAAPAVSRIAAILRAYQPNASAAAIVQALVQGSVPLPNTRVQANFNRKVDLLGAARQLPLPAQILESLEADSIYYSGGPLIDEGQPDQSIVHDSYETLDHYELQLSPDNRNFRNIEFTVKHKKRGILSLFSRWKTVYYATCPVGNKILWDGVWNQIEPNRVSDLSKGQYLVEVKVNGQSVTVQPPKIKRISGNGGG